jgi:hypothetical protein
MYANSLTQQFYSQDSNIYVGEKKVFKKFKALPLVMVKNQREGWSATEKQKWFVNGGMLIQYANRIVSE